MRGIKGLKEEMAKMLEDIREELREQGIYVNREMEEMKRKVKDLKEETKMARGKSRDEGTDGEIREKNKGMGERRRRKKEKKGKGIGREN